MRLAVSRTDTTDGSPSNRWTVVEAVLLLNPVTGWQGRLDGADLPVRRVRHHGCRWTGSLQERSIIPKDTIRSRERFLTLDTNKPLCGTETTKAAPFVRRYRGTQDGNM
jgi:hypothetical protein